MNYSSSSAQSHYRHTKRRKKQDQIKIAIMIIPIVLLTVIFVFALKLYGTDAAPVTDDNVRFHGNGVANIENQSTIYLSTQEDSVQTEQKPQPIYTDREVNLIAKTVYGEALVTNSDMEMSAVVWCILNRVDSPSYPNTIEEVVTQRRQFHGYDERNPVTARIESLVRDVLDRWYAEKNGETDCGRVLPKDYIYFEGDGKHNHYSTEWLSKEYWDWSLPNPYEN